MRNNSGFRSRFAFSLAVCLAAFNIFLPTESSANFWQCTMQIPKTGNVSSWCGANPINIRMSGSQGSGWIGMNPFTLWVSGRTASGWLGQQPISLWKSGRKVTGWVGQSPVNCRVQGKNNLCITFTVSDSR